MIPFHGGMTMVTFPVTRVWQASRVVELASGVKPAQPHWATLLSLAHPAPRGVDPKVFRPSSCRTNHQINGNSPVDNLEPAR
jgi:hypothetical protein